MRKTFLIGAALSVLIVSLATAFEQQSPYLERVSTGRALADDAVLVIPRSRQDTTEEKLNTDASQDTSTQAGSSPGNSAASPGETKAPTSGTDSGSDSSPASSAAKSPTPKQPDDRDALLTSLYVGIEKPGISKPVYKEQELVDPFKSCLAAPSDGMNTTSCYEDDEYNDRLTFELTFSVRATVLQKAFEKHFPRLELSPEDRNVAQPQIGNAGLPGIEYSDYTAKVTVSYHCQSTSSGVISLKLVLQLGDAEKDAVTIEWMKICKSGINNNIEFGYLMRETGQTAGPSAYSFAEDSIPALVVAPSDVSTEVYLKIQEPGARQEFVAPYVTTTNPDVASVAVRGNHPSGGVLKYLEQSTFQLSYECLRKGNLEIHTTIGIPPFNNLTATWTKECGGNVATSLRIGSSEGQSDIVDEGKPTPRYKVGIDNLGTAHSDEHLHLPDNQSDWTIYMRNAFTGEKGPPSKDGALQIGRITLTIEHPDKVAAATPKVSVLGPASWRDTNAASYVLEAEADLRVSFHFICRKKGESRILITVPVLQHETLEFGIAKECEHEAAAPRKSREFVITVRSVFWSFIFLVVICVAIFCIRRRTASAKGFEPLPVTER